MMHRLEITRGRQSAAPALVKRSIRFARRLREHGIWNAEFPPFINDGRSACKITIGKRAVNIFDDGSFTRSLLRSDGHIDGRAFIAQSNRMHAIYLSIAGNSRLCGGRKMAREYLNYATQERRHYERCS